MGHSLGAVRITLPVFTPLVRLFALVMIADFLLGLMCTADILLCKRTPEGGLERGTPAACSHVGSGQDGNINKFYINSRLRGGTKTNQSYFSQ